MPDGRQDVAPQIFTSPSFPQLPSFSQSDFSARPRPPPPPWPLAAPFPPRPLPPTPPNAPPPNRALFLHETSPSSSTRASKIIDKLPPFLQKYATGLRGAPVSHVVAFLVLHEITAIVPLLGLFGLFHYTQYAPAAYITDHWGSYVSDGVARFERYFKRKGWFGFGDEATSPADSHSGELRMGMPRRRRTRRTPKLLS
ncbi:unnamed protein product [Parascedosporium putredinis]|uniref:Uncharacterized protein n=1 Tax=Parascedosporium putredinis TaxID=1442378 RepID=A0A9P1H0R9_9PEZI|nr:unnamed protein product [Parascedosporium putredinis]CAI7993046.1 unnamed protein product [Parascedosporium putredinis]